MTAYSTSILRAIFAKTTPLLWCMCTLWVCNVQASLSSVMSAEFALQRSNPSLAMTLYTQEALNSKDVELIERSLSLAIERKNSRAALLIAKHWITLVPDNVVALFYLAHIALQQNEFTLASQTLDRILQLDPNAKLDRVLVDINPNKQAVRDQLLQSLLPLANANNASMQVIIAGLLAQNNRAQESLFYLDAALKQRPNYLPYVNLKAKTLLALGDTTNLNDWLANLTQKQPKQKSLALLRLRYLVLQKKYWDAKKQMAVALNKWPKDITLLFLSSSIETALGEYTTAQRILKNLVLYENYQDQAHYQLAQVAMLQNHKTEAIGYYTSVGGQYFQAAQLELAKIRISEHKVDEALVKLAEIRNTQPEQRDFTYQLQAQILLEDNRRADALKLLDQALQQTPNDQSLLYTQFLMLERSSFSQKEQIIKALLDIAPNDPKYLNAYAFILAEENTRLKQARFLIGRAFDIAPNQPDLLDTLGVIQYRQKNYDAAIKSLQQAYKQQPDLMIGVHLLHALKAQKQQEQVQILLSELNIRYPNQAEISAFEAGKAL